MPCPVWTRKVRDLSPPRLFHTRKAQGSVNLKIHIIWISTSQRHFWDLDLSSLAFAYFEDSIQIHLCLLVCWLEGPINSGLLSWFRGEEIAQALVKLSSLDIWEKSWKGVCRSTIRYNSSCTPFNTSLINLLGLFLSIICFLFYNYHLISYDM